MMPLFFFIFAFCVGLVVGWVCTRQTDSERQRLTVNLLKEEMKQDKMFCVSCYLRKKEETERKFLSPYPPTFERYEPEEK